MHYTALQEPKLEAEAKRCLDRSQNLVQGLGASFPREGGTKEIVYKLMSEPFTTI
jgi:hypothetical protein